MAEQVTNYKCPACTGPIHYNSATGRMECDYCGSSFTVEEVEKMYAGQDAAAVDAMENAQTDEWETSVQEWTEEGMKSYTCPSCGAELVLDDTTAATECPYCGSTTMIPGQFAGTMKPEYVIPFKLDKDAATAKLKEYYKGKPFLPDSFTQGNHIEEIKGVYVPFWLYDGKAHAVGTYAAEKSDTRTEGEYKVTTTEYYRVDRAGDISFEKIPSDASTRMPDDLMDSIEPYDYSELTEFSSAYMAGYMADKYDVSAEDNAERATSRAKNSAISAMKSDIKGYDRVKTTNESVSVKQGKVSYAMLPVWMLNTKWNGQNYLFAMNGQSGRFVGALPVDKKKVTIRFILIAAILELLMGLFSYFTGQSLTGLAILLQFVLVPFGISAIVVAIQKGKMNNVAVAQSASEYITEGGMKFTVRSDNFIRRDVKRERIEQPKPAGQ